MHCAATKCTFVFKTDRTVQRVTAPPGTSTASFADVQAAARAAFPRKFPDEAAITLKIFKSEDDEGIVTRGQLASSPDGGTLGSAGERARFAQHFLRC